MKVTACLGDYIYLACFADTTTYSMSLLLTEKAHVKYDTGCNNIKVDKFLIIHFFFQINWLWRKEK